VFENFWTLDTKGGVLPFTVRHPIYDGVPLLDEDFEELLDPDDEPILDSAIWLARFADSAPRTARLNSKVYRVSFELDILNG
jgi:hypothetical protein